MTSGELPVVLRHDDSDRGKCRPDSGNTTMNAESTNRYDAGTARKKIAAGILSRLVHTGFELFDKYLGDALYAAMVYVILRLSGRVAAVAPWAMAVMTAIELFQLTMIPAHMLSSGHGMVRICARLMGTEFSFLDLLTYAVGIAGIYLVDATRVAPPRHSVWR